MLLSFVSRHDSDVVGACQQVVLAQRDRGRDRQRHRRPDRRCPPREARDRPDPGKKNVATILHRVEREIVPRRRCRGSRAALVQHGVRCREAAPGEGDRRRIAHRGLHQVGNGGDDRVVDRTAGRIPCPIRRVHREGLGSEGGRVDVAAARHRAVTRVGPREAIGAGIGGGDAQAEGEDRAVSGRGDTHGGCRLVDLHGGRGDRCGVPRIIGRRNGPGDGGAFGREHQRDSMCCCRRPRQHRCPGS